MVTLIINRRYRIGDRVVGHAYAPLPYRMRRGTVLQVRYFNPPPGHKVYQVRWDAGDGGLDVEWHDERELSPMRSDV